MATIGLSHIGVADPIQLAVAEPIAVGDADKFSWWLPMWITDEAGNEYRIDLPLRMALQFAASICGKVTMVQGD